MGSNRGITNFHVPSDIIIDNSLPTAIRAGGKMWNVDDKEEDFIGTVPDRGYGQVFSECVEFCKKNGAFDPTSMGACPNVGLMAQKAEEYGSHPNTFEAASDGTIRIVVNGTDQVLLGHAVKKGDIYRACQTKDGPIKDWVKLAVNRCRANNFPRNDKPCKAIFWLDSARTHDVVLMERVQNYLPEFNPAGLDIEIMSPVEAMRTTLEALDKAVGSFLTANKNPSRKVNEIDNRGSHYWVACYWAEELSKQDGDKELKGAYAEASKALADGEVAILDELVQCQGKPMDLGGYYRVDKAKTDAAMNPSSTLNAIIANLAK